VTRFLASVVIASAAFTATPRKGPAAERPHAAEGPRAHGATRGRLDNVFRTRSQFRTPELTLLPRPTGHYTFLMACALAGLEKLAPICGDSGPARLPFYRATIVYTMRFDSSIVSISATNSRATARSQTPRYVDVLFLCDDTPSWPARPARVWVHARTYDIAA
jgi:hypothetical protein